MMHTLDTGGDTRLEWNTPAERTHAEETFRRLHNDKKYRATMVKGGERTIIHKFDPSADAIVLAPQSIGG